MPHLTPQQVESAKEISVLDYVLRNEPNSVIPSGMYYKGVEHDSFIIFPDGGAMWYSRDEYMRNAIDYLMKYRSYSFPDAVIAIVGDNTEREVIRKQYPERKVEPSTVKKTLELPRKAISNERITEYLKGRGIPEEITRMFIELGMIYESDYYHSLITVGYDSLGTASYCAWRATDGSSRKGDFSGSQKKHSFKLIPIPNDKEAHTVHFFEAAIDLMSYVSLQYLTTKTVNPHEHYVSLGGIQAHERKEGQELKLPPALEEYCKSYAENITTVYLHLDADKPGRIATENITELLKDRFKVIDQPTPYGKDFNDYLKAINTAEGFEKYCAEKAEQDKEI